MTKQEISENLQKSVDVLLARMVGEPHNMPIVAQRLGENMFKGVDSTIPKILEIFQKRGNYDPFLLSEKLNRRDLLTIGNQYRGTNLETATDVFLHYHSMWVAANVGYVAESGIIRGKTITEIQMDVQKHFVESGAIQTGESNEFAKFEQQLDAKLQGIILDFPAKPFLQPMRDFCPYWLPGSFIIVGGRPSMGKSQYGLQQCLYSAMAGVPTTYVNLENIETMVYWRLFCLLTGIDRKSDFTKLTPEQLGQVAWARKFIKEIPLKIKTTSRNFADILAFCRADKMERNTQLFGVDYFQLIVGKRRGSGIREDLTDVSGDLAEFARQADTVVLCMAQIGRGVEKNSGKRPTMADLKETGAAEQDATDVILLHRPEYYNMLQDEDGNPYPQHYAELIYAKGRNDGTCMIQCRFDHTKGFYMPEPPPFPDPKPMPNIQTSYNFTTTRRDFDVEVPF